MLGLCGIIFTGCPTQLRTTTGSRGAAEVHDFLIFLVFPLLWLRCLFLLRFLAEWTIVNCPIVCNMCVHFRITYSLVPYDKLVEYTGRLRNAERWCLLGFCHQRRENDVSIEASCILFATSPSTSTYLEQLLESALRITFLKLMSYFLAGSGSNCSGEARQSKGRRGCHTTRCTIWSNHRKGIW